MAHSRERKPLEIIKGLPQAIRQARDLFFTKPVVVTRDGQEVGTDESAFAVPKGIDPTTKEGQLALRRLGRARANRRGVVRVEGAHIEPGRLPVLLAASDESSNADGEKSRPNREAPQVTKEGVPVAVERMITRSRNLGKAIEGKTAYARRGVQKRTEDALMSHQLDQMFQNGVETGDDVFK